MNPDNLGYLVVLYPTTDDVFDDRLIKKIVSRTRTEAMRVLSKADHIYNSATITPFTEGFTESNLTVDYDDGTRWERLPGREWQKWVIE